MRTLLAIIVVAAMTASAEPPKTIFSGGEDKDETLKLGIESGRANDHGRDNRVFTIPVTCGDAKANFTWGCGGQTLITAAFADKARVEVRENENLKTYVDGAGRPIFVGESAIEV